MTEDTEDLSTCFGADFGAALRAGSASLADRTAAVSAATVRARGDRLRRRRTAAVTVSLAVALLAACGGGMLAVTRHSGQTVAAGPLAASSKTASGSAPTSPASTRSAVPDRTCQSLVVPAEVKEAVTDAYRRSQPGLVHITPVKGSFYYGRCASTYYAASSFTPTPAANEGEQVQLQDYGAAEKYFTKARNGPWTYVNSDGLPRSTRGCAAIPQIPRALTASWADCLNRP
jgi:hypothetical protein